MNQPAYLTDQLHRARGALLGLAVGDAIGTTVEFKPRGSFAKVFGIKGDGPFGLKPGQCSARHVKGRRA